MQRYPVALLFCLLALVVVGTAVYAVTEQQNQLYLPVVSKSEATLVPAPTPTPPPPPPPPPPPTPPPTLVEFRGLWVSRFDWTLHSAPVPATIDEIVDNAANAGFNAILFQVRGEADAYYESAIEPWSRRLTGTLGQHPGWDPLARLIERAHGRGLQVHAFMTVYPVWESCTVLPAITEPLHLYHRLKGLGTTSGKVNHLQWDTNDNVICGEYIWGSPASLYLDNHILSVTEDLASRYNLDGIHLDRIRYAGSSASCDPVSQQRSGVRCFTSAPSGYTSYAAWQRAQVNGTVRKFHEQIVSLKPQMWLSAAVWFNYSSGFNHYYQDSKGWAQSGHVDALMPMIYPVNQCNNPDPYWSVANWQAITADFIADSNGRHVIPGIGGRYCDFNDIEARIYAGRAVGASGHAIFSYNGLKTNNYFERFRNGPYAQPAVPPALPWRP
jgi:uncharacterized lipoprotein YddW (UPF0748 family)